MFMPLVSLSPFVWSGGKFMSGPVTLQTVWLNVTDAEQWHLYRFRFCIFSTAFSIVFSTLAFWPLCVSEMFTISQQPTGLMMSEETEDENQVNTVIEYLLNTNKNLYENGGIFIALLHKYTRFNVSSFYIFSWAFWFPPGDLEFL